MRPARVLDAESSSLLSLLLVWLSLLSVRAEVGAWLRSSSLRRSYLKRSCLGGRRKGEQSPSDPALQPLHVRWERGSPGSSHVPVRLQEGACQSLHLRGDQRDELPCSPSQRGTPKYGCCGKEAGLISTDFLEGWLQE